MIELDKPARSYYDLPPRDPSLATSARPAYHRVLAGSPGSWWRLIVAVIGGTVGLIATSTAALLLVVLVGRLFDPGFTVDPTDGVSAGELFALNLGLALLIPLSWGIVKALYGEPRAWLSSVRPGIRMRWLLTCAGAALVVWSLQFVLSMTYAISKATGEVGGTVAFIAVVVVTQPFQAAGEEFLFRGVLLQALGSTRMPTWLCCALDGALFASAHQQFDPPLFADRFLLGVALSYVVIATGGLESSIALHSIFNITAFIPAGLLGKTADTLDPPSSSVFWVRVGFDAVLLAFALWWIISLSRRGRTADGLG